MLMHAHPSMDWSHSTPIPFGRYEGHATEVLYDRPDYIVWLMGCAFVYDKHRALYNFLLAECSQPWFAERLFEHSDSRHRQRVRDDL